MSIPLGLTVVPNILSRRCVNVIWVLYWVWHGWEERRVRGHSECLFEVLSLDLGYCQAHHHCHFAPVVRVKCRTQIIGVVDWILVYVHNM